MKLLDHYHAKSTRDHDYLYNLNLCSIGKSLFLLDDHSCTKFLKQCNDNQYPNQRLFRGNLSLLALYYEAVEEYEISEKYSSFGINQEQGNPDLTGLPLLYIHRGVANYRLNRKQYLQDFQIGLSLAIATRKEFLYRAGEKYITEDLSIDLSSIFFTSNQ
ncbi:MAG: hypothetical protein Q4G61_07440 [Tissierellia bacterium]|nr:hypothetical protein [Tissierellia bacterium]